MPMSDISLFPIAKISQLAEKESWRKEINRPIYHIHKWWAQRLGSVFRAIILYLHQKDSVWQNFYHINDLKGSVVLDPFMGSGTTIGESVKLGARAIGCDINPVSSFLVRQELTHISMPELYNTYRQLESSVANKIKNYHVTINPKTGNQIPVLYYFWTKVVKTPDGIEIPLFDRYVFAQNAYASKKPQASIVCPHCWNVYRGRYDDIDSECPQCHNHFNPQNGPAERNTVTSPNGKKYNIKDLIQNNKPIKEKMYAMLALNEEGEKIYLPVSDFDINLFEKAKRDLSQATDLFSPNYKVASGYNTDQAISYGYRLWKDFFNERQLLCLGLLLKEIMKIDSLSIQEQFLCLFSSTLEFNNMFCSFKGEGTGAVRPIFSNHILKPERTPLENSVWGFKGSSGCFSTLFDSKLIPAKNYLDKPFEVYINSERPTKIVASNKMETKLCDSWNDFRNLNNSVMILNGDSSNLPIPNESVDFVITDPPYFDFIHYSELSDFFYAWLSPILKDRYPYFESDNSRRKNEVQQTDPVVFSQLLGNVFKEAYRVTKEEGKLVFSFHHSRIDGWTAIANSIKQSGFYIEEVFPVHAELMASTPKAKTKEPISIDAIIICSKKKSDYSEIFAKRNTNSYIKILSNTGKSLSRSDLFVISASQCLPLIVNTDRTYLEYESVCNKILSSLYIQKEYDPSIEASFLCDRKEDLLLMYAVGKSSREKTESTGKLAIGVCNCQLEGFELANIKYVLFHYWNNEKATLRKIINRPRLVNKEDIPDSFFRRMEKNADVFLLMEYDPYSVAEIGKYSISKVQKKGKLRYIPFVTTVGSIVDDPGYLNK